MIYKTLKDHVYDYISKKINDGTLKPNERKSENRFVMIRNKQNPVRS